MAQFFPPLETVSQFRPSPTQGEWHLLKFLDKVLDNSFEVFFNPYLNGDRPDVVILRKGGGAMIIEVKDWNLGAYKLDENKHWHVKNDPKTVIGSPIDQCTNYKKNLYELHCEELLKQSIKNPNYWSIVHCCVYFHFSRHEEIEELLVNPFKEELRYLKFISHIGLLGYDDLERDKFIELLRRFYLLSSKSNALFPNFLYETIRHVLIPPIHLREQGSKRKIVRYNPRMKRLYPHLLMYTKKQDELIFDEKKRKEWRVKGAMGSGKTLILAAKAVQIYKELKNQLSSQPRILILTFNITLKNLIHDKLNEQPEEFEWKSFAILNYHSLIKSQLNNEGIQMTRRMDESDESFFARYFDTFSLFDGAVKKEDQFDAILIDEVQDYKREWLDIVKGCFLKKEGIYPQGGYFLFGDVKQNIYSRPTKEKDVITNVRGVHKLETCFRSNSKIKALALSFQKKYFPEKYEVDEEFFDPQDYLFLESRQKKGFLDYIFIPDTDAVPAVFRAIEKYIANELKEEAFSDISILAPEVEFLQALEVYSHYKTRRNFTTAFEKYETILLKSLSDNLFKINMLEEFRKFKEAFRTCLVQPRNKFPSPTQCERLFSSYHMFRQYPNDFKTTLELYCREYKVNASHFLNVMEQHKSTCEKLFNLGKTTKNEGLRRCKKWNFWANSGLIKISTIHSFKGWETNTVFFILQEVQKEKRESLEELLYTGLTRAKENLVILNVNNKKLHQSIQELIEESK